MNHPRQEKSFPRQKISTDRAHQQPYYRIFCSIKYWIQLQFNKWNSNRKYQIKAYYYWILYSRNYSSQVETDFENLILKILILILDIFLNLNHSLNDDLKMFIQQFRDPASLQYRSNESKSGTSSCFWNCWHGFLISTKIGFSVRFFFYPSLYVTKNKLGWIQFRAIGGQENNGNGVLFT